MHVIFENYFLYVYPISCYTENGGGATKGLRIRDLKRRKKAKVHIAKVHHQHDQKEVKKKENECIIDNERKTNKQPIEIWMGQGSINEVFFVQSQDIWKAMGIKRGEMI